MILVVWGIRVALRLIGQPLARLPVALGTFIVSTVIVIARWQAVFEPPEPPRTLEDMKYLRDGLEVFVMTPDMIVNYSYAAAACLLTSWTIRREWVALSLDASVLGLVLPCTVLMGNRYTSAGVFALTVVFVVQVLLLAHASARDRRPAGARGGRPANRHASAPCGWRGRRRAARPRRRTRSSRQSDAMRRPARCAA